MKTYSLSEINKATEAVADIRSGAKNEVDRKQSVCSHEFQYFSVLYWYGTHTGFYCSKCALTIDGNDEINDYLEKK